MDSYLKTMAEPGRVEINQLGSYSKQFLNVNQHLFNVIERALLPYRFQLSSTHDSIEISGDEIAVKLVSNLFAKIGEAMNGSRTLDIPQADLTVSGIVEHALKYDLSFHLEGLSRALRPKSLSQVAFLQKLLSGNKSLIFGIGPTGTGKTHLAIAVALNQLAKDKVKRIIITRPHIVMEGEIVTASTRTEMELDDQFEYLEDVFDDLVGFSEFSHLVKQRKIELMPLGHMRGRTFNNSFVVIDEAQNMTIRKMRMAVTRIGQNSQMVVTGNPNHVDLLGDEPSGLIHLLNLIKGTDLAEVHYFEKAQVIRTGIAAELEELYLSKGEENIQVAA